MFSEGQNENEGYENSDNEGSENSDHRQFQKVRMRTKDTRTVITGGLADIQEAKVMKSYIFQKVRRTVITGGLADIDDWSWSRAIILRGKCNGKECDYVADIFGG